MEIPRTRIIRLPEKMRELVDGIAAEANTNQNMVIPIFLATLASVAQAKFEIHTQNNKGSNRKIPLAFYALLIAESGAGKTPIFEKITGPLDAIIDKNNAKISEANKKIMIENRILDSKIKQIMKEGTKHNWKKDELTNRIMELENEKAAFLPGADIYTTNSTPEGLAKALNEQEGHRFSILDSEGSSVRLLCRYPILVSQLNHAYDNESFSATRAKDNIIKTINGVSSVAIYMQPEKLKILRGKGYIWYEGLIPRMLPFFGGHIPLLDQRRKNLNVDMAYKYYNKKLKYLFYYPWKRTDAGDLEAHPLSLDADAISVYEEYKKILAPLIFAEEDLIDPWRIKAIQKILRIAALFHLYEVDGDPLATPISPEHIELAGDLLCDLIPNVEYIRELVAPTEFEKIFKHVISWLHKRFGQEVFTIRDISKSTNMKSGDLLAVLGSLLDEGVLDPYVEPRRSLVGRPPAGGFRLNWERLIARYPLRND